MKKEKAPKAKPRKKRGPLDWLLNLVILALLVAGVYLIARPRINNYLQDQKTAELLTAFDDPDRDEEFVQIVIGRDDLKVDGEELEAFDERHDDPLGDRVERIADDSYVEPDEVGITIFARLDIPKINLVMPVADESSLYSLRVAIGHYSTSAKLGEVGNSIFFGHRMYAYGRHFHRLDELEPGDLILFRDQHFIYTYEVDKSLVITPGELPAAMAEPTDKARVLLVTCTPLTEPRGTHRLLVYGQLKSRRPRTD